MRQCQCGGVVDQWLVKAGETWRCRECGRQETVPRQASEPDDEPQAELFEEQA